MEFNEMKSIACKKETKAETFFRLTSRSDIHCWPKYVDEWIAVDFTIYNESMITARCFRKQSRLLTLSSIPSS